MFDDDDEDDYNEEFHILPLDEINAHELSCKCKCQPENVDGYWIHYPIKMSDAIAFLTDPSNLFYN